MTGISVTSIVDDNYRGESSDYSHAPVAQRREGMFSLTCSFTALLVSHKRGKQVAGMENFQKFTRTYPNLPLF